jgi:hypothetical protein
MVLEHYVARIICISQFVGVKPSRVEIISKWDITTKGYRLLLDKDNSQVFRRERAAKIIKGNGSACGPGR